MKEPAQTRKYGDEVQSVKRAMAILDTLAISPKGLTVTDLAGLVHLPTSTTHRLLTTMESGHYVHFECVSRCWALGKQLHINVNPRD